MNDKQDWTDGLLAYVTSVVEHTRGWLFYTIGIASLVIATLIRLAVYRAVPDLHPVLQIPLNVLCTAGLAWGGLVFTMISYRASRRIGMLFGFLVVVTVGCIVSSSLMQLRIAGLEPLSGPPLFGVVGGMIVFGWLLGWLLWSYKSCSEDKE